MSKKNILRVALIGIVIVAVFQILLGVGIYHQINDWQILGWKSLFNENILLANFSISPISIPTVFNMYRCYEQLKNEFEIESPSFRFILINWWVQSRIFYICLSVIAAPIVIIKRNRIVKTNN